MTSTSSSLCLYGLMLCVGLSCRTPPEPQAPKLNSKYGVHYDTKYEALITDNSPELVKAAWSPYVDTLSEPVAISEVSQGRFTWNVYFATNRDIASESRSQDHIVFTNTVRNHALLGQSKLELPRRRRGVDPKRSKAPSDSDESVRFLKQKLMTPQEFYFGIQKQLIDSRQQDLLIFVHGFNVSFDAAIVRTAQIALDLPFNGAIVCYSWPSQGGISNYAADETINQASVQPFQQFLEELIRNTPRDSHINIVVHSMGNRMVMQAINELPKSVDLQKPLNHVVLCAPDVGKSDYNHWAPGVAERANTVTLYTCAGDSALVASQVLHREQRAGYPRPPIIVNGVDLVDCSSRDFSFMGHSYYGNNISVLTDLFSILKENKLPAQRPHLTKRETDRGEIYWSFDADPPEMLWTWNFPEKPGVVQVNLEESTEGTK